MARQKLGTALLFAAAALLLAWFALPPQGWLERAYARGLYPALAQGVVPLTDALPFSLALLLAFALPLGWLGALSWRLRQRRWRDALVLSLAWSLLLALWFVVLWGANYRRASVEALLALPEPESEQVRLEPLLAVLEDLLRRDASAERDEARALAALSASLQSRTFELTGVRPVLPARLKLVPAGWLLRLGGAAGVMSPWTLEPHVDAALPGFGRLAVGVHELAHVAGFAGEADAELMAALAGFAAEDGYARYAVALRLYLTVLAELPPQERRGRLGALPAQVRADVAAWQAPFVRYRPSAPLAALQRRVYDGYLRSQGVSEGVGDYSRAVRLLASSLQAGWLEDGGLPPE